MKKMTTREMLSILICFVTVLAWIFNIASTTKANAVLLIKHEKKLEEIPTIKSDIRVIRVILERKYGRVE